MQSVAVIIGTILGYAIGHIIRIAGPQIEELLANAIKRAFKDTAEIGKPNSDLQQYGDSLGLFRENPSHSPAAGDGDDSKGTD